MKYTYLLIDVFSVLFPLLFSFHPKLKFYRKWPALIPAVIISGLVFIVWDSYFTELKVWGFNPQYLMGCWLGNLPLEEVLFFFCIPYACVFTYASLPQKGFTKKVEALITGLLIAFSIIVSAVGFRQLYTVTTFSFLAVLITAARFIFKITWLSRFYQTYLLLLVPFLIVNGLLTGTGLAAPVVWYNNREIFNVRILSIPLEDVFYGMALILLNLLIYNYLLESCFRRVKSNRKSLLLTT
jgi:lycopene cyclase domain-containing protein